jgi:hypothetical protein
VFQAFRLAGGKAQLPFLDARVVNFFCSLPYSARAFYRGPKQVIRDQFRRQKLRYEDNSGEGPAIAHSRSAVSPDALLLQGSLGDYFRGLLRECTLPDRVPGMFELVDEHYFSDQVRSFRKGDGGFDGKFISKLAALEFWSQTASGQQSIPFL